MDMVFTFTLCSDLPASTLQPLFFSEAENFFYFDLKEWHKTSSGNSAASPQNMT